MLIGTGFPGAFAKVDFRLQTDFLVGSVGRAFGGIFFLSSRFDDGAEFFDVVDNFSSSCSPLEEISSGVALIGLFFDFSSVWRLTPAWVVVSRVRFPVRLAHHFVGLLYTGEALWETCRCVLFEHRMLWGVDKKRRQGPELCANMYAT